MLRWFFFLKNSKESLLYIPIYLPFILLLHSRIPDFFLVSFPFNRKNFLIVSYRVYLLSTNSLDFSSSENIFISSSFLNDDVLLDMELWVAILFFQHFKDFFSTVFWPSLFLIFLKSRSFNLSFTLQVTCCFTQATFKVVFFFSFGFSSLIRCAYLKFLELLESINL